MQWGNGNNQTMGNLLDSGYNLTLIPGEPKCHCGSYIRVGSYGGQEIDEVLAQVHLTVGSVGTHTHPVVISPALECIIGTDIFSNWQNPHNCSLSCGAKDIMLRSHHNKPLELPLPRKMTLYLLFWGRGFIEYSEIKYSLRKCV